jgi:peptidoglycan/LPS O-acetylase OafA/YrhL
MNPPAIESPSWYVKPVDALRVLLCLYIIVFHAHLQAFGSYRFAALSQGIAAVNVFFVISGYGLMSSFLRHGGFPGGIRAYFLRRAARLLPLYYACLALSFLSVWLFSIPRSFADLSPQAVLGHALLVQNFMSDDYSYAINSTYWFVAVEAQLYVLFPFLALLWRRHGAIPALLSGISAFAVLWILFSGGTLFARPQFIVLLLLGMLAAAIVARARIRPANARLSGSLALAVLFFCCCAFLWAYLHRMDDVGLPFVMLVRDLSSGLGGAAALVVLSVPGRDALRTFLSHPLFGRLAPLSYAAYLSHDILLRYTHEILVGRFGLSHAALFFAMVAVAVPVIAAVSWLLHALIERPFLRVGKGA